MEIDVNRDDERIEVEISENIENTILDNYIEKNELVDVLRIQIEGWKASLKGLIESRNNKCILIYQSFVILELFTKAKYFYFRKVTDYNQRINVNNFGTPKKIGHKINDFIKELLESDEMIDIEKNFFQEIKEKIDSLEKHTNLEKIEKYPDLRYNLSINGDIIDKNINVTRKLIKIVEEVINFANV